MYSVLVSSKQRPVIKSNKLVYTHIYNRVFARHEKLYVIKISVI